MQDQPTNNFNDGPIPDSELTRRFAPISLGDWMGACQRANIPHVPSTQIATLNRYDYLRLYEPGPHLQRMELALEQARVARQAHLMQRLDFCAPASIKDQIDQGITEFPPQQEDLFLTDARALTILPEYPREIIPIWQRPWVNALIKARYPVEYRAFVYNGELRGISNYYPQRNLRHNEDHINAVRNFTMALVTHAPTPFLWNLSPFLNEFAQEFDLDQSHFTADYIVSCANQVFFLEAGPPHGLGAHPCCFATGSINGIALLPQYIINGPDTDNGINY